MRVKRVKRRVKALATANMIRRPVVKRRLSVGVQNPRMV